MANVTTEATTYWNEAGKSEPILLFYDNGEEIVNVTSEASFEISKQEYKDKFSINSNHELAWHDHVVPGTYKFNIKATYKGIEKSSDLLTIHANPCKIDNFDWAVVNNEGIIYKYNGGALYNNELYLPNTCVSNNKTYTITKLSQKNDASVSTTFPGVKIVHLNDGLKTLDTKAIYDGDSRILTTIYLSPNLESIGKDVFDWCDKLTDIYYPKTVNDWVMNINKNSELFIYSSDSIKIHFDQNGNPLSLDYNSPIITFNKTDKSYFQLDFGEGTYDVKKLTLEGQKLSTIVVPDVLEHQHEPGWFCTFAELLEDAIIDNEKLINLCFPSTLNKLNYHSIDCQNLSAIFFLGTKEQWNKVEKDEDWIINPVEIVCLDGTIPVPTNSIKK